MRKQKGFFLGYVLGMVAVLGVLTALFSQTTPTSSAMGIWSKVNEIVAQTNLIRSLVAQCATDYPSGDNGTGFRINYPGATTLTSVSSLTCPGAPGVPNLWSGTGGVFLPIAPVGFSAWQYINNGADAHIQIQATSNTGQLITALAKVQARFGGTEATLSTTTWANDTLIIKISI